jgi:hypothetical protein
MVYTTAQREADARYRKRPEIIEKYNEYSKVYQADYYKKNREKILEAKRVNYQKSKELVEKNKE